MAVQTGGWSTLLRSAPTPAVRALLSRAPLAFDPATSAEPSGVLGRSGALEVRLAAGAREVRRAQRTRYKVFFEEMDALPSPLARLSRRDSDLFDEVCDHLLVFDHDVVAKPFRKPKPRVVGTYRLLRRDVAEVGPGFYSAGEFDLGPLLAARPDARILELGRSCVLKPYRSRQTLALLWQGIWAYVRHHGCDVMVGCASLPGTDPQALALPLSYLHHFAAAPPEWRVAPHRALHQPMDLLPRAAIDPKAAFKRLPPLLKGYLRLGASIGSGAVIDRAFGTTDVFVVTPIGEIGSRYLDHFSPAANRVAA